MSDPLTVSVRTIAGAAIVISLVALAISAYVISR